MDAVIIHENPVFLAQTMEIPGGKKAGYLVYNEFNYLYHQDLNDVFSQFKNLGIDEMILDLRYNPGGSVLTAALLASMLYSTDTEKRFIKYQFNEKHQKESNAMEFFNQVYHQDRNDVFSQFKHVGIDDMILYLRYNPGG